MATTASRRSSGESTVYQDATGRWHAYVSMGLKDNGKRDRRHVSGPSRKTVVDRMKVLESKRDAQTVPTAGRLTVGRWLDYWLENVAARKVRVSTLDRYEQLVTHQLKPKLGHHRLDRLQPEHIEKAYGELLTEPRASGRAGLPKQDADGHDIVPEPLSPASVVQAHRVLSRALKVAMQRGKIARNVCTLVEPPTVPHREVEPFDLAAARAILRVADAEPNGLRWYVGLALGPRQGECLGLQLQYVDLANSCIHIRWALQRQRWRHGCEDPVACGKGAKCPKRHSGGLVLAEPKSRAGRRTIALPSEFVAAFTRHLEWRDQARRHAGSLWEEHGLVFCQPNGRPLDPRGDHRAWRALLVKAKVDPKRLHDARHTAATIMLAMGVPPRVVMEILGHSQISITQNTYTHVLSSVAVDAAARIGAAFAADVAAISAAP